MKPKHERYVKQVVIGVHVKGKGKEEQTFPAPEPGILRSYDASQMAKTGAEIKEEILTEIRNIILYRKELLAPTNRLDYEEFQKKIISFAGAVYHFKERLAAWVKKVHLRTDPSIQTIAERSVPLLVCGDLFNYKKHGGCENRSKLSPHLSEMNLETVGEPIGIRYDGKLETGELDRAVPYTIEILCSENRTCGHAVRFIANAFSVWVPIMQQTGLLNPQEAVEAELLSHLSAFASDEP